MPPALNVLVTNDKRTDLFAENLRRHLAGAPLLNLVDRVHGY